MTRTLLVATTNPHKLEEIRQLLGDLPVTLHGLEHHPPIDEPEETGATFADNARLKACAYAAATGCLTIAEDSGLVVDAMEGGPGVFSARYLGPHASYAERFEAILQHLREHPERPRTARFVCALVVAEPDGRIRFEATGTVEGEIATSPAGSFGFGYDPIFHYPPYGRTLAEVSPREKLAVAHRGEAVRALARWLEAHEV